MERFKTILLILFIAGIIGAFNTVIRMSQSGNESPLQVITNAIGLTSKPSPEPGRPVDYVLNKLSTESQTTQNTTENQNNYTQSTPAPGATVAATPTPTPAALTTTPELPPLPPIGGDTRGVSTQIPELPPLPPLETPDQDPLSQLKDALKDVAVFFGF